MNTTDLSKLLDLSAYVQEHPPREPFLPTGPSIAVYAHPFERIVIQRERTADLGYGLCREAELGAAGRYDGDEDSRAFASSLCAALSPQLSIQMLKDLCAAFSQELAEQELSRTQHRKT